MCECGREGRLRRGMCGACYARWLRRQPGSLKMTPLERFWAKVNRTETCWLWTATGTPKGYGQFSPSGSRQVYAHRYAYELLVGAIPDGLTIDHLCRNRRCVNPAHLEPVTRGENTLRGTSPSAINARRTHCANGHAFTEENTYREGTKRRCRACARNRKRGRP